MQQTSIVTWLKQPVPSTGRRDERHDSDSSRASSSSAEPPANPPSTAALVTKPALPVLAPNVVLAPLTPDTLPSFRRLNSLLLEIPYPAKFYDEILSDPATASVTLAAFWHDEPPPPASTALPPPTRASKAGKPILVAGIRCRLFPPSALALPASSAPPGPLVLYIATLGTLSPYRSHGLATHLLSRVVARAARDRGVRCVCAHVWVANADGLDWYRRRGFEVRGKELGYYRKLQPSDAWLVLRNVGVRDLLPALRDGVGIGDGDEDADADADGERGELG